MSTPYRDTDPPAEPTVCAVCVHKTVSKFGREHGPKDPDNWLCRAKVSHRWPAVFHPVTGETDPAWDSLEHCARANTSGDCPKYERRPPDAKRPRSLAIVRDSLTPPTQTEGRPAPHRRKFWPDILLLTVLSLPALLVTSPSAFSGAVIGLSLAAAWALGRRRP